MAFPGLHRPSPVEKLKAIASGSSVGAPAKPRIIEMGFPLVAGATAIGMLASRSLPTVAKVATRFIGSIKNAFTPSAIANRGVVSALGITGGSLVEYGITGTPGFPSPRSLSSALGYTIGGVPGLIYGLFSSGKSATEKALGIVKDTTGTIKDILQPNKPYVPLPWVDYSPNVSIPKIPEMPNTNPFNFAQGDTIFNFPAVPTAPIPSASYAPSASFSIGSPVGAGMDFSTLMLALLGGGALGYGLGRRKKRKRKYKKRRSR